MAEIHKLSDLKIRNLRKEGKVQPGRHSDGGNLYLDVSPSGAAYWLFIYRFGKKQREMGLGSYPDLSLASARDEAENARKQKRAGIDPIEARKSTRAEESAKAQDVSFGACALTYINGQEEGWKNEKHRQQWRNTLTTYCERIWLKDVAAITNQDIKDVLDPIWTTKHETATRVRGRIERVLGAAKVRGLRAGENPARWKENLDLMMPAFKKRLVRGHHKAKPHEKVKDLVAELRQIEAVSALALEFTVLAAKRTSEVREASWLEIDLANRIWNIPGARMKMNRDHREPLTDRQMEILAEMAKLKTPADTGATNGGYVFKGRKHIEPISTGTMYMLLKRLGHDDATVHGFRSSFRDWTADKTTFPRELAEMSLSHKVADDTEEAYWRSDGLDKRRKLMDAWARYVEPQTEAPKIGQLRPAAK